MNKIILLIVFSIGILSLFLITENQIKITEGTISKINYRSYGVSIEIKGEEYILLENRILNISEGDFIIINYLEQTYNSKPERVIEKIIKN